eukprot:2513178-Rhodomonas_salina.1
MVLPGQGEGPQSPSFAQVKSSANFGNQTLKTLQNRQCLVPEEGAEHTLVLSGCHVTVPGAHTLVLTQCHVTVPGARAHARPILVLGQPGGAAGRGAPAGRRRSVLSHVWCFAVPCLATSWSRESRRGVGQTEVPYASSYRAMLTLCDVRHWDRVSQRLQCCAKAVRHPRLTWDKRILLRQRYAVCGTDKGSRYGATRRENQPRYHLRYHATRPDAESGIDISKSACDYHHDAKVRLARGIKGMSETDMLCSAGDIVCAVDGLDVIGKVKSNTLPSDCA